jgi:hypothetical protein
LADHATSIEMTVIAQRTELIDWYVRRRYSQCPRAQKRGLTPNPHQSA